MARTMALLLCCAAALGHGESARTNPGGVIPIIVVPTTGGGSPAPPRTPGRRSDTRKDRSKRHTWEMWWAYHREYYLARAARGRPTTGPRELDDVIQRKELREEKLIDLLLDAIEDKNHDVRAAAAIALGKFGASKGVRGALERHVHRPPEDWFDVRESSIYSVGLLGLPENRRFLDTIATDKDRAIKEQSLALTGLMMDGSKPSADMLEGYARHMRSGVVANADVNPARAEQDRRRFAVHLLGFVDQEGYDDFLWNVVRGARQWGPGEQGLAATALGRRRARPFKEVMFRALYDRQGDKNVIRSLAIALGMMLGPEDEADLKRLGRFVRDSRRDPIAQNFTVMALGQIGGDTAVSLLRDFLDGRVFGDAEDRAFVYLALGLCGTRSAEAREVLLTKLERSDSEVERGALAVACGLARAHDAVPLMIDMIEKPHLHDVPGLGVRGRMAGWMALGLGLSGDARATGVVRRVLGESNDPFVCEQAAIALALLRRGAAAGELLPILHNAGSLHAKAAVAIAMSVLPEPSREAVDGLIKAYRDDSLPDPVRAMAITALGVLADPRPVAVSALLVRNYNYFIRCHALDEIASYL